MIYEFTAGYNYWYIDTDRKYVKITDKNDGTVVKETDQLRALAKIEGGRIAAYDDTCDVISISAPLVDNHFLLEDYHPIIWQEDPQVINLFFRRTPPTFPLFLIRVHKKVPAYSTTTVLMPRYHVVFVCKQYITQWTSQRCNFFIIHVQPSHFFRTE